MKKTLGWAAGLLALAVAVRAAVIIYDQYLVNDPALAVDTAYSIDLLATGVTSMSAQAVYSSATFANVAFTDGTQSTGSFTVLSNTALSSAAASNKITVTTNDGTLGASIILPGYVLREGLDWAKRDVASNTAVSLAVALARIPILSVSRVDNIVFTTAPYGSYWNNFEMISSTPTALTVATARFAGGQDNASITINGTPLRQGIEWWAGATAALSATAIKDAINAHARLSPYLSASAVNGVIHTTSTLTGTRWNFAQATSSPTAISRNFAAMAGGTNPAMTLNSATINKVAHGLYTGVAAYFSTSTVNVNSVPGNLTNGTTYWAIRVDADNFKLASSKSNAAAGTAITVNSTTTQTTANTFTLYPLGIDGEPSFKWQVSNDGTNWSDMAVSSVTMLNYSNPPASTLWSFGYVGTRYIRANVVAPTAGAINISIRTIGTN